AAIGQLESLRAGAADYLVVPATAAWWLDHYSAFHGHLERTCRLVHRSDDSCAIYALRQSSPWLGLGESIKQFKNQTGRHPAVLDWPPGAGLADVLPECAVFAPPQPQRERLPYIDHSIDLVAISVGDQNRLAEAYRVASTAVITVGYTGSD